MKITFSNIFHHDDSTHGHPSIKKCVIINLVDVSNSQANIGAHIKLHFHVMIYFLRGCGKINVLFLDE